MPKITYNLKNLVLKKQEIFKIDKYKEIKNLSKLARSTKNLKNLKYPHSMPFSNAQASYFLKYSFASKIWTATNTKGKYKNVKKRLKRA